MIRPEANCWVFTKIPKKKVIYLQKHIQYAIIYLYIYTKYTASVGLTRLGKISNKV